MTWKFTLKTEKSLYLNLSFYTRTFVRYTTNYFVFCSFNQVEVEMCRWIAPYLPSSRITAFCVLPPHFLNWTNLLAQVRARLTLSSSMEAAPYSKLVLLCKCLFSSSTWLSNLTMLIRVNYWSESDLKHIMKLLKVRRKVYRLWTRCFLPSFFLSFNGGGMRNSPNWLLLSWAFSLRDDVNKTTCFRNGLELWKAMFALPNKLAIGAQKSTNMKEGSAVSSERINLPLSRP